MARRFNLSEEGIIEALEFLSDELHGKKVSEKDVTKTRLLAEECLFRIKKDAPEKTVFEIWVRSIFGSVITKIKCRGSEIRFSDVLEISGADLEHAFDDEVDDNAVEMIQSMLLKGFADKIRISRRKNMNYIDIITKKNPQMTLYVTLSSIVLAVIMGVCMRLFLSESITGALCSMVLNPVKTIYMNLLSMVVGPVVFFSMITCMIQFSDLRSFGRIGGKTMGIYMFTSLVAGVTGIGVFYLLQPGTEGSFVSMITTGASSGASISLLDTIIDIFPSNVVGAFYENNVLQILLMGLILGVMVNMIGEKGKVLQNIFDSLNELFLQLVMVLARLIPLITFCSVMILILTTGTDALVSLLALIGTLLTGLVILIILYSLMIALLARISPFPFLKRYVPTALNVMSLCSSSASMPLNMDFCRKIGISQRVYSFSIPFGATINMDGAMVAFMTGVLFMAKTFGVDIDSGKLIMLLVSGLLVSVATPGVPGAFMVACTVLLNQTGVPMDCIPLLMVFFTITDMVCTASNTTGDVAASVIVAGTENLLDKDKYYQKG